MIAIIGAMEEEVEILRSFMKDAEQVALGPYSCVRGTLVGVPVVLLKCGIGKVNAAIGAALLLERFQPQAVVNTGSAGGLLASQNFGDLIVSDSLVQHDVDIVAFGYEKGQVPGLPARLTADPAWVARAEAAIDALSARGELPAGTRHTRGVVGSGDVFVHEPELIERLRRDFPDLCAVEMEGAAIAQVCAQFGTPFVVVRALSDIAGKESPMTFDEYLPLAARNSSLIVMQMLAALPAAERE